MSEARPSLPRFYLSQFGGVWCFSEALLREYLCDLIRGTCGGPASYPTARELKAKISHDCPRDRPLAARWTKPDVVILFLLDCTVERAVNLLSALDSREYEKLRHG